MTRIKNCNTKLEYLSISYCVNLTCSYRVSLGDTENHSKVKLTFLNKFVIELEIQAYPKDAIIHLLNSLLSWDCGIQVCYAVSH